jgi:hypothetical protein
MPGAPRPWSAPAADALGLNGAARSLVRELTVPTPIPGTLPRLDLMQEGGASVPANPQLVRDLVARVEQLLAQARQETRESDAPWPGTTVVAGDLTLDLPLQAQQHVLHHREDHRASERHAEPREEASGSCGAAAEHRSDQQEAGHGQPDPYTETQQLDGQQMIQRNHPRAGSLAERGSRSDGGDQQPTDDRGRQERRWYGSSGRGLIANGCRYQTTAQ